MALQQLSAAPPAPSRMDSPGDFVAKADPFLAWMAVFRNELVAFIADLATQITGTDFSGTSTSSVAIGTGDKTFSVPAGKQWQSGQPVRVAYTTTPTSYMDGVVKTYTGTSLVVTVASVAGTGTFANWTIALIPGSGGAYATLTGTQTLDAKTLTNAVIASFLSGGQLITVPPVAMTLAGRENIETFKNKTFDLLYNNLAGTLAQFNAALAGDDFVAVSAVQELIGKTLAAAILKGDCSVTDDGTLTASTVGLRGIPVSANATGTLQLADIGKAIHTTSNQTIPSNAALALPIGYSTMIVNTGGSTLTIGINTDTLEWSGTAVTGTRTLLPKGEAFIRKIGATTWRIKGDLT